MDFQHEADLIKSISESLLAETQNDYLRRAVVARLAETEALLYLACSQPYPFNKALRTLSNAINDTINAIEHRNSREIKLPPFESEEQQDAAVTAEMDRREQSATWLDQARITATLTLVHLTKALDKTALPPNLKVV